MASTLTDFLEEARLSARALLDYGEHFFNPTVRLGVTGLSRAGKTVFITALVHGLTRGGRFPVFEPLATGRIARAHLAPQPDDAVPRFDYENHVRTLIEERRWPNSTIDISELRLGIDYQRPNCARGIDRGDDGPPLRGLQGRGGAPVLPRSFRAARSPDRADRRARCVQFRPRSVARSRSGAHWNPRLFQDRTQHDPFKPVQAA